MIQVTKTSKAAKNALSLRMAGQTMSIEAYKTEHQAIEQWHADGWLTYNEYIRRHLNLREKYLAGRRSRLMPVIGN